MNRFSHVFKSKNLTKNIKKSWRKTQTYLSHGSCQNLSRWETETQETKLKKTNRRNQTINSLTFYPFQMTHCHHPNPVKQRDEENRRRWTENIRLVCVSLITIFKLIEAIDSHETLPVQSNQSKYIHLKFIWFNFIFDFIWILSFRMFCAIQMIRIDHVVRICLIINERFRYGKCQ